MKNRTVLKILRMLILIIFLLGTAFIAVYPFPNRDLHVVFTLENGSSVINVANSTINIDETMIIEFDNIDSVKIENAKIYATFDSMYVKKVSHNELFNYIESVQEGEVQWQENGIQITGNDGIHIVMRKEYTQMLLEQSESFLMERIMLVEVLLICCALIMISCKVIEEKAIDVRGNHGPIFEIKRFVKDIMKYGQYMIYAARTDLKAEVANSYLNRLWWLLEPLFNMLVYVIVFGKVMGSSVENYVTFIFSSLLMWNFFSKTINYSVQLVRNNRDIVSKVYVPKFILLLSNMFLNFFKLLFSLIVLVIMLLIFRVQIGYNIFWILPAYIVMMLLAFGAGMIFLHFGVYVDDLSYAINILLSMLMFLSGIFYDVMETLPAPLNTLMMCLNPAAVFIDTMRNALLYNVASNLPILGIWFVISVILCCVGVHIVYKNENGYVKVV